MQFTYFVGIDVSKATLDCSVVKNGQLVFYKQIANSSKAIRQLIAILKREFSDDLEDFLFAMEHTGLYTYFLKQVLVALHASIWLIAPLHLSRSSGLQRGKNDKIDSERIAFFALKNGIDFRPHVPVRPVLNQIKRLFALRRQLVKSRKQLLTHSQNNKFMSSETAQKIEHFLKKPVSQITTQIKNVEDDILNTIHVDADLSRKYLLVSSVMGVGFVLTVKILLITNEFKTIRQPRKLACMAGVAPFDFESGTSVKKLPRISTMADKELKSLLHMAALVAIREPGKFKEYYVRKKEEGKHSMKVINAIRNKLIHCMFACVNNDRIFLKNYQRTA